MKTISHTLSSKGYRITKARNLLINFLEKRRELFNASDVLSYMKLHKCPVNKTTVYRDLEMLKREGIIREVPLGLSSVMYEVSNSHHHHIICNSCQAVEHIDIENVIHSLEHSLQKKTKFTISNHIVEFIGMCDQCYNK